MPVIQTIYQRANLELSTSAENAMRCWNVENKQHKHKIHRYSLKEFGLSGVKINSAFTKYIEQFTST